MMRITQLFRKKTETVKIRCPWKNEPGTPFPLGVSFTPEGTNFAVFAEHARKIWLVLFETDKDCIEIELDSKKNKTGAVWHIRIAELPRHISYGYRVDGPNHPEQGHRYNKEIVLLDPYCHALSFGKLWGEMMESKMLKTRYSSRHSCIVDHRFDWEGDAPLRIPIEETVIYEMHVRGFTKDPSSNVQNPGTFQGVVDRIPYLKDLGITAVELLPVCEFDENDNPSTNPFTGAKLKNFWGYNTTGFFAPKASYASNRENNGQIQEFKNMVKRLHQAGIEVILDMVFNHTAEGNEHGPSLHFRGLDNSAYYILGRNGKYMNYTGCGNTVSCNHTAAADLILDCLRYWVVEMHVDGFRFDLASAMTRDRDGTPLSSPYVIQRIAEDTVLKETKLIAEPWDCGGLYQVGNFPHYGRWSEWNGKFRDDIRSFVKGDNETVSALASRLLGSPDLYKKNGRVPAHSINFITCHDGFTLYDLVSYNNKRNDVNGEKNRDGADDNRSWNCGREGNTDDPKILQIRKRQMKNFISLLLLSQGVPMILAGDEFARTQNGNNNTYCQDNEISWLNWNFAEKNYDQVRFMREMIALRKSHPALRQKNFMPDDSRMSGFVWHGVTLNKPDWSSNSHTLAFLMDSTKMAVKDKDIYVAINSYWEPLDFEIPSAPSGNGWRLVVDTAKEYPADIVPETDAPEWTQNVYHLAARSLVVLISKD